MDDDRQGTPVIAMQNRKSRVYARCMRRVGLRTDDPKRTGEFTEPLWRTGLVEHIFDLGVWMITRKPFPGAAQRLQVLLLARVLGWPSRSPTSRLVPPKLLGGHHPCSPHLYSAQPARVDMATQGRSVFQVEGFGDRS